MKSLQPSPSQPSRPTTSWSSLCTGWPREPLSKSELVVHKGRGYLFNPGPPLEVVIHDPLADRLEIIDLKRRIRTEISFKSLEEYGDQLHQGDFHRHRQAARPWGAKEI